MGKIKGWKKIKRTPRYIVDDWEHESGEGGILIRKLKEYEVIDYEIGSVRLPDKTICKTKTLKEARSCALKFMRSHP